MDQDNQKTILIIEDETDIRQIYSEILREAGYIVLEAGEGNTGLEIAKNQNWDLLLLDIMLPGQDGLHVLKEIKKLPEQAKKPVLLLTNLESEPIITECFALGADGYLIKSEITPDFIVAEVRNYF
jgi:two-component system chemotaxis response regulator CheY